MALQPRPLADQDARRTAISDHARSLLVEAGAGSGKTAVLAGRIANLLAEGVEPRSIVAVTFTELAASELFLRVRRYVEEMARGRIPDELRAALPDALSDCQLGCLRTASSEIDEMVCTTIHGFCQRLIRPYPVEARIDPGASVMDRDQADLVAENVLDDWLRESLSGEASDMLVELVQEDPKSTIALVRKILAHLRRYRDAGTEVPAAEPGEIVNAFRSAAARLREFVEGVPAEEADTNTYAECFAAMAEALVEDPQADEPGDLVALLCVPTHPDLLATSGDFYRYRKKTKWGHAARGVGLSKADGDRLFETADGLYGACCATWTMLQQSVAACVLASLVELVHPVLGLYQESKRTRALLDFDDLLVSARDLLRDHEEVRRSLAARFRHVLVDEFQDTDPVQAEIFWRLCGDPPGDGDGADWTRFQIRPGALFLVGDPKQAIYRFRGAEVSAYLRAREAFRAHEPDCILEITTNFRSRGPILGYVNERFQGPLSAHNGQPGYTALAANRPEREEGPAVVALDIGVAAQEDRATADEVRDSEAEAMADMCARLIGSESISDPETRETRPCRPGDIALLAPTGSDLWRYEEALEARGIPVATQAGKGLYRRQEIQDLIAITRVLADQRDTLALGALLRGPLVGLSEEELLDIIAALPRPEGEPDALPQLSIGVDLEAIAHPLAQDILGKLQALRRRIHATTPHNLLSEAVDVLRVRPILLERHGGQAERALANVDLYLGLGQAFAVRGLRAFAEAMTAEWTDESRAVEGRPDAQENSVALYTMHAAKGLEWPIVMPVNTMTRTMAADREVSDRGTGNLYFPVLGVAPSGHGPVFEREKEELNRERVRLWYVACTRARELLVVPRFDVPATRSSWKSLVDLTPEELPALDLERMAPEFDLGAGGARNEQTRERFSDEAAAIEQHHVKMVWRAPSRSEGHLGPATIALVPQILASDGEDEAAEDVAATNVQGGQERGRILHKLIEEVLTGETPETTPELQARATFLIEELELPIAEDPARGLAPAELAQCVVRSLAIPEVAALRPRLIPEVPVYAIESTEEAELVTVGIADAIAFGPDGTAEVVVDWKSDVDPTPETLEHYAEQVRTYMEMTLAERGLIVALTPGAVFRVTRGP